MCSSFSLELLKICHPQEQAAAEGKKVECNFILKQTLPPLRPIKLYSFKLIPIISCPALSTLLAVLCSQSQTAKGSGSVVCAASAPGSDRPRDRYSGLELVKCRLRALKTGVGEEKQSWNKTTGNMQNKLLGQASAWRSKPFLFSLGFPGGRETGRCASNGKWGE